MRKTILLLVFTTILGNLFNSLYAQNKAVFLNNSTAWADSVLAQLSEEERIAQLFMVAAYSNKESSHKEEISTLIKDYKIGGLMFLQGSPTKQVKLTIGIPVYNGEKFLEEKITSILNQDFIDFELIISDNASTDSTKEICNNFG